MKRIEKYKRDIKRIHESLNKQLVKLGFHEDIRSRINDTAVSVGLAIDENPEHYYLFQFNSDIMVIPPVNSPFSDEQLKTKVLCSSANFNIDDKQIIQRIKHTNLIIEKWDVIMDILKNYCEEYSKIVNHYNNAPKSYENVK